MRLWRVGEVCVRKTLDAYYTPDDVALRCVRSLGVNCVHGTPRTVVEPSVGGGAFVRAVRTVWPTSCVVGCDIDPNAPGLDACDLRHTGDWLQYNATIGTSLGISLVIVGNPPYADAEAHIVHAHELGPVAIGFLLRLGFLESNARVPFWHAFPPTAVRVLSKRPSFTGGGTDSTAYAWFEWVKGHRGPATLWLLP
jgi:hypothetical protein